MSFSKNFIELEPESLCENFQPIHFIGIVVREIVYFLHHPDSAYWKFFCFALSLHMGAAARYGELVFRDSNYR